MTRPTVRAAHRLRIWRYRLRKRFGYRRTFRISGWFDS